MNCPDGEYHELLRHAREMEVLGFQRRATLAVEMHRSGKRPPDIARELERRARAAGCDEAEVRKLGISEHNVRLMLRGAGY